MKNSLSSTLLLTAAVLTLLLIPQPSAAEDSAGATVGDIEYLSFDEVKGRGCDAAAEKVEPMFTPLNPTLLEGKQPASKEPPSKIQNGPCSFCNSNSNCSTACIDDNGNQSDCGDYGVCDPCKEALVEIGRVVVAQRATDPFYFTCEFKTWSQVTYRSANSPSCWTITQCERDTTTSHSTGYTEDCCTYMPGGCFGVTC